MLVTKINFPSSLEYTEDLYNDNLNVFVELEDGSEYCVIVGTPKNILYLMDKDDMNFSEVGIPFIIVRKLTFDIIKEAIEAYAEGDAKWLKLHRFAAEIRNEVYNKLREEQEIDFDIDGEPSN